MTFSEFLVIRSVLVYLHFLIPVQGRVLPLLTALRDEDLHFRWCPSEHASEQADGEALQTLQVVGERILFLVSRFGITSRP